MGKKFKGMTGCVLFSELLSSSALHCIWIVLKTSMFSGYIYLGKLMMVAYLFLV